MPIDMMNGDRFWGGVVPAGGGSDYDLIRAILEGPGMQGGVQRSVDFNPPAMLRGDPRMKLVDPRLKIVDPRLRLSGL